MNWNSIISAKRTGGLVKKDSVRTNFQQDFDRIIFSSAFRRLQDKTQIFALPGATFVHNRLTHSLETASVGRSLGKIIGEELTNQKNVIEERNQEFYRYELQNVIAAACLAHDIGNPPFGHSGEDAISNYFIENKTNSINGKSLKDYFSASEWTDLTHFEGNANSFRILTHKFKGKSEGGFRLTYTTLAAMTKYPCSSSISYSLEKDTVHIHQKKYSFFSSDQIIAKEIMNSLGVKPDLSIGKQNSKSHFSFNRHPFVFLTEAADDICYRIVDYEDAHRLNIISYQEIEEKFIDLIDNLKQEKNLSNVKKTLLSIEDKNEKVAFLRSKVINSLTLSVSQIFIQFQDKIISGNLNINLIDHLSDKVPVLKKIAETSWNEIYNHSSVVQLEIAGFKVMSDLLSLLVPAVLQENPSQKEQKIQRLIPTQFEINDCKSPYLNVLSVLDYLSGMTDVYIIDLYRKLFGIEIPNHK